MNAPAELSHVEEKGASMVLHQSDLDRLKSIRARVTRVPAESGGMSPLWAALAKAQGEFEPILSLQTARIQMTKGGEYSFTYADLEEIIKKTRPALSAQGIGFTQLIVGGPESGVTLLTILFHESGAAIESELDLPSSDDIKEFGGYVTYVRRYVLAPLLGVASQELIDHDGSAPGDGSGQPSPSHSFPTHPDLEQADTLVELSKVMNRLPIADRKKYHECFNECQRKLSRRKPVDEDAAA